MSHILYEKNYKQNMILYHKENKYNFIDKIRKMDIYFKLEECHLVVSKINKCKFGNHLKRL